MIALKCPSCSANLTLDDSREFGFCQYCGTKIQLVQRVVHSGTVQVNGVHTWQQKLDAAKTLLTLGEYDKGNKVLLELTDSNPQLGEGWLYTAKLRYSMRNEDIYRYPNSSLYGIIAFHSRFYNPSLDTYRQQKKIALNSPEQARDLAIRYLTESKEMTNAKKILGANHPEYQKMLSEFTIRVQNDCQKTLQQIKILERTPMKIVGMTNYGIGGEDAFYEYNAQLMKDCGFDTGNAYYTVSVVGGRLEFEIAMCSGVRPIHRHHTEYILYADDHEIWTDRFHYIYNPMYSSASSKRYGDERRFRSKTGACVMCGGKKGVLGCKARCKSNFK